MKNFKKLFGLILAITLVLLIPGCPGAEPKGTVISVTITQGGNPVTEDINAFKGETLVFSAEVIVQGNAADTVDWSIEGASAATTINAGALRIAATEADDAEITVTASSTADPDKRDTVTVKLVEQEKYTITVENGIIDGATDENGQYLQNSLIWLIAEDRSAVYEIFVSWTLDGEVVSNTMQYSLRALKDGHYVANFENDPNYERYTITVENGTINGTVDKNGQYIHDTLITLIAEDRIAIYEIFVSWTLDGVVVSDTMQYSLRALKDGHYIANYFLDPDAPPLVDPLEGSAIFVQDTDGTDDGVERLIETMFENGLFFYKTQRYPSGLIGVDDVVILKHNCQWPQRGGTNTDLIRSVIQAILDHPGGFKGEIIVADNGHAQYSSGPNGGGSLDWAQGNAKDRSQSVLKVINGFKEDGYKVTGSLWDVFARGSSGAEFSTGNMNDGFIRDSASDGNGWRVSYAKFTSEYGTHISFKNGIWDAASQTYNREKLKVINMPVLKYHTSMHFTGALKGYFGTHTQHLGDNHGALGGLARQMIVTGLPALHIMDMIFVGTHHDSPRIPYANATEINKIAASNDPVALDYWSAKYVLRPAYTPIDANRANNTNPDGNSTFGNYLRANKTAFNNAGIPYTNVESEFRVFQNGIEN